MLDGNSSKSYDLQNIAGIDQYCPQWYVIHTRSRYEKRVNEQLEMRRIEVFLPLYRSKRNWNGRNAMVDMPLFPGYVFVHIPLAERLRVLAVTGVAGLVSFKGAPAPVPDNDLHRLRDCLTQATVEPVPYFHSGDRVRVIAGPLTGMEGIIVRHNGSARFVLSIDLIMRSVSVNVDACDLELVAAPLA